MFKKILVPIDGSEPSWQALEYAGQIGEKFDGELLLLHIIQPFYNATLLAIPVDNGFLNARMDEMKKDAEVILNAAKDRLEAYPARIGVKVETGNPSERILALAEEEACDAIVIGSRGLSGIAEFVLGGVSSTVAQCAHIPVVIVKSEKIERK